MKIFCLGGWVFYVGDSNNLNLEKSGKWMYFFSDKEFASKICKTAVEQGIVTQSKHSDAEKGVACFYLNCDDVSGHQRVIKYFIDNNLIRKTKKGRLYNISFKLDSETRAGVYGEEFHTDIKLENFVDLDTGEWK